MTENEKYLFETPADEKQNSFTLRIGGTLYEVTTHLKTDGTRTVLNRFKEMLLANQCV